jgi:hypothetical protein
MEETLNVKGNLHIVIRDANGNIKEEREEKNLVVTAGLGYIASRMVGTASTVMSHMEVGTNSTAAAAGDTTLGAAVAGSRTALTSFTASGAVSTAVCTFGAGVGTGALTEAGIFNASSGGTMLCRTVFSVVNKGAADSMTITWTITVS